MRTRPPIFVVVPMSGLVLIKLKRNNLAGIYAKVIAVYSLASSSVRLWLSIVVL